MFLDDKGESINLLFLAFCHVCCNFCFSCFLYLTTFRFFRFFSILVMKVFCTFCLSITFLSFNFSFQSFEFHVFFSPESSSSVFRFSSIQFASTIIWILSLVEIEIYWNYHYQIYFFSYRWCDCFGWVEWLGLYIAFWSPVLPSFFSCLVSTWLWPIGLPVFGMSLAWKISKQVQLY